MKCTNVKCRYEWKERVENPKKCPKCLRWIKALSAEVGLNQKEGD